MRGRQRIVSGALGAVMVLVAALAAGHVRPSSGVDLASIGQSVQPDDDFDGYLDFAQSRRSKIRDDVLRERLLIDQHGPKRFRVSTVRNIDAWYTAFKPQPDDKLYLSPDARVRIW